ncbi:hypothetical protein N431DRAFT_428845 [Stipitochalara longipes BDJ]|nr:hypothetical protein N431DRAFT_428845 [Stipitochalara longipes BDJ]
MAAFSGLLVVEQGRLGAGWGMAWHQRCAPTPRHCPARPSASHAYAASGLFCHLRHRLPDYKDPASRQVNMCRRIQKVDSQPIFNTTFACGSRTPSLAPFIRFAAHSLDQ